MQRSPTRHPIPGKLKVCHVAATTEGATWVFEQLRELRDRHGFEVAAVLNGDSGTLVDRFRAADIPIHVSDFAFTSRQDVFSLPRKVLGLARLFRRERFDVVQTHLFHSMVIGRIAGWIADVPVRLSMIAGPFHLEAYTPRWIDKATSWMDSVIIASCQYTRQLYRELGVSDRRLAVIYYGPDEDNFDPLATPSAGLRKELGWPDDTLLVGMVAYFYTELGSNRWYPPALHGKAGKGHEDLIRAAPRVLREFPQTKFLLIGKGWGEAGEDVKRKMQALVADLGLQDSVVFTGFRPDVPRIYRDLDVSVQPSLNENLGGTIESLLMQRPTVATRVGGMIDSVVDGETGILVNPADPPDLAEGILRLLRDPTAARALGRAGRERMLAGFTLTVTASDLAALYRRLLQPPPGRYRWYVTPLRLLTAGVFCFGVALRFLILDAYFLPRWDYGWRPWHLKSWMSWPRIWFYRFCGLIGRNSSFGLRRKMHTVVYVLAHQPLTTWPRIWLYRLYAFVGRHSTFGLRMKIGTALRRLLPRRRL